MTCEPLSVSGFSSTGFICTLGIILAARAQAVQARAARMIPSVHMNPVLLKPETDSGSQVIVQGKRWGTLRARNYLDNKAALLPAELDSFARLAPEADTLLVDGA